MLDSNFAFGNVLEGGTFNVNDRGYPHRERYRRNDFLSLSLSLVSPLYYYNNIIIVISFECPKLILLINLSFNI